MPATRERAGAKKVQAPLTAYGAAKLVNEALKERGVKKRIPPQMMYNYTHARVAEGKRPFIMYTKAKGVDRDDLNRWLGEYLDKLD